MLDVGDAFLCEMFLLEVMEVEVVFVLAGKGNESLDEAEVEL